MVARGMFWTTLAICEKRSASQVAHGLRDSNCSGLVLTGSRLLILGSGAQKLPKLPLRRTTPFYALPEASSLEAGILAHGGVPDGPSLGMAGVSTQSTHMSTHEHTPTCEIRASKMQPAGLMRVRSRTHQ